MDVKSEYNGKYNTIKCVRCRIRNQSECKHSSCKDENGGKYEVATTCKMNASIEKEGE